MSAHTASCRCPARARSRLSPDTASINSGVVSAAKTAQEALAANSAAMNRLFKELKGAGIADRDLQTSNFNIAPQYAPYDPKKPQPAHRRIIGYQVSNGVTVRVRDLAKLGGLIDQMTTAGANRMNGISFYVDKTANLMEEARRKAMTDVRRKADLYADGLGVKLKRVLTISENVSRPGRGPCNRAALWRCRNLRRATRPPSRRASRHCRSGCPSRGSWNSRELE